MLSGLQEMLIANFLPVIATALATWLTSALSKLIGSVEKKYNIDIDDALEFRFSEIVDNAVHAVQQSYVGELKKKGKFQKEQHAEALNKAIALIKEDVKGTSLDTFVIKKKSYANAVVATVNRKNGGLK